MHAEAAAAQLQEQQSADEEYITEQLHLLGLDHQDGYSADGDADADSDSESSQGDPDGRGLEAFEDVLSSWLSAAHIKTAHPVVKAQASLPLRPKAAGQASGPSTLQRIQEQQQQVAQEEAKGPEKRTTGAAQGAEGKLLTKQGAGRKLQVKQKNASAEGRISAEEKAPADDNEGAHDEDDSEEDDDQDVAGCTDVMSDWMTAACVTGKAQHAQQPQDLNPATKAVPQQGLQGGKIAASSWLADVSSDDDTGPDNKESAKQQESGSVQAPSTASLSEAKPHTSSSPPITSSAPLLDTTADQSAQHAQQAAVPHSNFHASLPPPIPKPSAAASASPNLTATQQAAARESTSSGVSSPGISSQDRKLEPDLLSRAKSDPSAFWPTPLQGYPASQGDQSSVPLPVAATSVPPPVMYSADQGLAPQVLFTCALLWVTFA